MVANANLTAFATEVGVASYEELHRWSVRHRAEFWGRVIDRLGVVFHQDPTSTYDGTTWLPGARLNIVESCFRADPHRTAVLYARDGGSCAMSYGELRTEVERFASGVEVGERIAIAMPMTIESVVAYLGTIAAGGVVVSIADSFAPHEIETRLRITGATTVVTQDVIARSGKTLPMCEKVVAAGAERAIVVDTGGGTQLRAGDVAWDDFLGEPGGEFVIGDAGDHANVLFSSGTTGEPKAIPWSHTTPIKAAMDGHFHLDIHPDDVVAWPTNLGWMMGPWLIFASLINEATFALYDDVPTGRGFCEFVRDAGITVLGVVPSLVAAWRANGATDGVDWGRIRLFSSTGEASNADDYAWLMDVAGGRPVVEYCGGTEIGGGYITGTVVQPAVPAAFSTPSLGLDVRILDEDGAPATIGELFLVPPSIGLSTELLNRDHDDVYFAGVPEGLRRHGDHMEDLGGGYYRAHGRVDDTMNLGGIKVSSAEIERVVAEVPGVVEAAAVAVPPAGGGPSRLVIYAVVDDGAGELAAPMQAAIRAELNPLFKIHEVVVVHSLPRTASNKVMRRELRAMSLPPEGGVRRSREGGAP